jgi:hypothetical protein
MYGYVVTDIRTALTSGPIQKSTAINIASPNIPLNTTEAIMLQGMTVEAFSISSAM